jgi:hypothetical protein
LFLDLRLFIIILFLYDFLLLTINIYIYINKNYMNSKYKKIIIYIPQTYNINILKLYYTNK